MNNIKKKTAFEDDEEIEEIKIGKQNEEEYDSENVESDDENCEINFEEPDLSSLIQHFFTNDDGENMVDVLSGIKKSIDIQNKLLNKLVNHLVTEKKKD